MRLLITMSIRGIVFILFMGLPFGCIAAEVYMVVANSDGKKFEEKCERLSYTNIDDALSYLKNNANNFVLILPLQKTKHKEHYFIGQRTDAEGDISQGFFTDSKRVCLFLWEAIQYKKQAGQVLYRFSGGIGREQACVKEPDIHSISDAFTVMVSHYGWKNVRIPEIDLPDMLEVRVDGEWQRLYFTDQLSCEKMETVFNNVNGSYTDSSQNSQAAVPERPAEQSEQSITNWCKTEGGWDPESCYCGAERPSWTESQAQQTGHRVKKDVVRGSNGRISRIRIHDYFMPDNGDVFSGFANIHTYFQTLKECKVAVASKDMP